jgi:hypothetical protein
MTSTSAQVANGKAPHLTTDVAWVSGGAGMLVSAFLFRNKEESITALSADDSTLLLDQEFCVFK